MIPMTLAVTLSKWKIILEGRLWWGGDEKKKNRREGFKRVIPLIYRFSVCGSGDWGRMIPFFFQGKLFKTSFTVIANVVVCICHDPTSSGCCCCYQIVDWTTVD